MTEGDMPASFQIEIVVGPGGVRAVRVIGSSWRQHEAYLLLERMGPLIDRLDCTAKADPENTSPSLGGEGAQ